MNPRVGVLVQVAAGLVGGFGGYGIALWLGWGSEATSTVLLSIGLSLLGVAIARVGVWYRGQRLAASPSQPE